MFFRRSFLNSKNLKSFSCINFINSTWSKNSFENVNENFSFLDGSENATFFDDSKLIGRNFFVKFSLNLFYKKINYVNNNNILLSGFNLSDINNFEMRGFLKKSEWENKGLKKELLDKYQQF